MQEVYDFPINILNRKGTSIYIITAKPENKRNCF